MTKTDKAGRLYQTVGVPADLQRDEVNDVEEKDSILKLTFMAVMVVAIIVLFAIAFITRNALLFLGFLIPLLTFFIIFLFMSLQRKRILRQLQSSFGQNVVRISAAIMDYFELPLTLLLSITLTLFFFAFAILAVIFWLDYLMSIFGPISGL